MARRPPSPFHFFAALPPLPVADQIATAWQRFGTGEPLRRDKLHLTLIPVAQSDLPPDRLQAAMQAAGDLIDLPAFPVTFDRLETWPQRGRQDHPLVLTCDAACQPAARLSRALRDAMPADLRWPPRPFRPHVTLALGKGFPDPIALPMPITWQVRQLALIQSLRGKGHHIALMSWPLADP